MSDPNWNEEADFDRQSQEWYEMQEEKYRYDTFGSLAYVVDDMGIDEFMSQLQKHCPRTAQAFVDYFYPSKSNDVGVLLKKSFE